MSLLLRLSVLLSVVAFLTAEAEESPTQVVVAIRYFKEEGVSHSHLDLFDGNGGFLRHLTKDESGQDFDPVFSPDGRSVVYQRTKGKGVEWRMVSVDGSSDRTLKAAPEWHAKTFAEPESFGFPKFVVQSDGEERLETAAKPGDLEYKAASGRFSLVLKDARKEPDPADPEYFPKQAFLRTQGVDGEVLVETLPVFAPKRPAGEEEFWSGPLPSGKVPHEQEANEDHDVFGGGEDGILVLQGSPFWETAPLQVAFLRQHRGSTDGLGLFALDLNTRRLSELAPNGGRIVPLPGMPWFAVMVEQRYLPFNGGSVNCSYLDLWSADMQRIRFGEAKPAICYGASILMGKEKARVISLRGLKPPL
ncbi:TolB family protein [Luteolibacter soli]|uniref:WD40 repeat protein n=1 Tax=Luteolibacter soli TaxID=3135280 RepID=A0ABU9AVP2_9BACT